MHNVLFVCEVCGAVVVYFGHVIAVVFLVVFVAVVWLQEWRDPMTYQVPVPLVAVPWWLVVVK